MIRFYEVLLEVSLPDGTKQRYKSGYTSSKTAYTKEMVLNGWKKENLIFIKKEVKKHN